MQRVGADGEGLLELAVDAQSLKSGGLPAEHGLVEVADAGRPGSVGAVLVDQQVRVGGGGPVGGPAGEPLKQDLAREVI